MNQIQVCLMGIQKYAKDKQIHALLEQVMGDKLIKPQQLFKPKMKPYCFLSFATIEEKDTFTKFITENKASKLNVRDATNSDQFDRQIKKKLKQEEYNQEQQEARLKPREAFNRDPQEVVKQTAPLFGIPYEEQIEQKQEDLEKVIKKFRKQYLNSLKGETPPNWIEDLTNITINPPIVCDEGARLAYRNKSEFTINYSAKNEMTVGFNCGSHQNNDNSVEIPDHCPITPKIAIKLANRMQEFIRSKEYIPFHRNSGEGLWRLLQVRRSDRTKQLLLSVSINRNSLSEEQCNTLKQELVQLFNRDLDEYTLAGLILMHSSNLGQDVPSLLKDTEILYGNNYYQEIILGKTINISYNAFVQNHIGQCDKMYQAIAGLCKSREIPKLLDICAGSGTIGICLSDSVSEVIAVEMVESSCKDAEINYQQNKCNNCRIICSKVEDVIKGIVTDLKTQKHTLIACLDPPRAGVIGSVVDALRTCKGLDQVIYVSCSPYSVIDNLLHLCLPESKRHRAPGFKLMHATMVDMFPQTSHFETIFYLERDYLI